MAEYFICSIGGDNYALPLGMVREVRDPTTLTRVPGVPDFVCGVTNLRGTIVCVIDLVCALGIGRIADGDDGMGSRREVVIEHGGLRAAILVEGVVGVAQPVAFEPVLDGLSADLQRWCRGTLRSNHGLALVLDPELLPALRERVEAAA